MHLRRGAAAAACRSYYVAVHRTDLCDVPERAGAARADRAASLGGGGSGLCRGADRGAAGQRRFSAQRRAGWAAGGAAGRGDRDPAAPDRADRTRRDDGVLVLRAVAAAARDCISVQRSEEHTSELQSLMRISYAVFCLKKKNKK